VIGISSTTLLVVAAVVLIVAIVIVLLAVRSRSRGGATPAAPVRTGPSSPTAIVCPFCKREYEPAETDRRCPGCGAAAPRGR